MFATTIFLTRTYQPAVYGEFRLLFSFVALVVILFLFGRDSGIIYYAQHEKSKKEDIIRDEVYYGFFMLLIGTFLLYLFDDFIIYNFLNETISKTNYHIALIIIPMWGIFNLLLAGIKAQGMINYSFLLSNLMQRSLRMPFFVLLTIVSTSYISLALSMILSQLVLIYLAVKKVPFVLNIKQINYKDFFTRFKYAFQLGFNTIIVVLLAKIDVIMIGKYSTTENVAIYDVSAMLAFIVMLPFVALVKSSEPFMKALVRDTKIQEKYRKNLKLATELSLGVLLIYILAGRDVLYIFGSSYMNGFESLLVLSSSFVILILLGAPIEVLNMNGYAKESSYILIVSIVINIVLNYILIPKYGIVGASIATGISLIFSKIVSLFVVRKKLDIDFIYQIPNIKVYILFFLCLLIGNLVQFDFWFFQLLFVIIVFIGFIGLLMFLDINYRDILINKLNKDQI
jgi:O-antigen/teichoic acid export membrane protein